MLKTDQITLVCTSNSVFNKFIGFDCCEIANIQDVGNINVGQKVKNQFKIQIFLILAKFKKHIKTKTNKVFKTSFFTIKAKLLFI